MADEEQLRELTSVPFADLRQEFQKGVEGMKNKLFHSIKVKITAVLLVMAF